jgi:hypothetical protein
MTKNLHIRPLVWFSLACAAVLASLATQFGVPSAAAATCPPPPDAVKPFTPWGDDNQYVLTTGGSFEPGSPAWTLTGGAAVVSGDSAPNFLDPSAHTRALSLPAGSSATSACVTAPHIAGLVRFFARNAGTSSATLKVEILVKGKVFQAGSVSAGSPWTPTPILASDAPYYKGAVTYQIRLTAVGAGGAFTVDDVYFDPYCSR